MVLFASVMGGCTAALFHFGASSLLICIFLSRSSLACCLISLLVLFPWCAASGMMLAIHFHCSGHFLCPCAGIFWAVSQSFVAVQGVIHVVSSEFGSILSLRFVEAVQGVHYFLAGDTQFVLTCFQ